MYDEGFKSLPKEKMARQADKAYDKEQAAARAGDEKETNKQMQRRIAMKNPSGRKAMLAKEEVISEGEKDACYHKVKSRYKVWPSAYASGALVKCRKKGAANWGNSTKKEDLEMVFAFLINEGFAETEDDALAMLDSMSDIWYDTIMEGLLDERWNSPENEQDMRDKRAQGDGMAGAPKVAKRDASKDAGRAAAAKAKDPLEKMRAMNARKRGLK